jgi:hypothetical protein
MKRLFALSFSLLLLAALNVSAVGTAVTTEEEPMTISWFGKYGKDIEDGNPIQKYIEEKFNVKLVNTRINHKDGAKIDLMISSGEHPDAMYAARDMAGFFLKGAFRSIPKEMIEEYCPGYWEMINATGPLGQNFALVKGKDDEYMGLPMSMDYKKGTKYMPYFRLDWLEKAGIEVKDMQHSGARISENKAYWTKEPFTFDEFVKILYTYRDGDFDGNGKADTIPFGCRGDTGLRGLWFLFTLYGMNGVQNYNDNGKTVMMATHSKLKESLKTGRKWFQEKLIDSELPNVDRASSEAKIVNGIVGAYISSYNYIALGINPIWDTGITASTIKNNPETKLLLTPMPLTVDGKALGNCTVAGLPLAMNLFCVKRETSDEKLVKILQIYDHINFDDKAMVYTQYGWPGENFEWTGTPWDSYIKAIDGKSGWGGEYGFGFYNAATRPQKLYKLQVAPMEYPIASYFGWGEGSKMAVPQYREDILNETDYLELWGKYNGALNTIMNEFIWEAIITDIDIDAEWDAYVERWLGAGGKEVLAELEKMPLTMEIRKGNIVY